MLYDSQMIVRAGLFLLCLYNIAWTAKTVLKPQTLLSTFAAGVFWLCVGTASFQFFSLIGTANEITRLCSSLLILIGLVTISTLRKEVPRLRKFASLLRHVEITSSIAALAEVDKEGAERMARMCRRKTAEAALRD